MLLTQKRSLFVNTNLTTLVLLVDNGSLIADKLKPVVILLCQVTLVLAAETDHT